MSRHNSHERNDVGAGRVEPRSDLKPGSPITPGAAGDLMRPYGKPKPMPAPDAGPPASWNPALPMPSAPSNGARRSQRP